MSGAHRSTTTQSRIASARMSADSDAELRRGALVNARASGDSATLVVENAYQWIGSPGLGAFAVYVDGRRAGVAPLDGQLRSFLS